jgi:hypothetical protein
MLTLAVMWILCQRISAQGSATKFDRSKEISLITGTSYYIGEINPYKHFGGRLHLGGGMSFRNNISKRWSYKGSLLYGSVEAWDKDSKDLWQKNRNLNFRNQFVEGSFQVELNFINYQIGSDDRISPYLFTGLAYFQMNPQGYYKGTWYPLQPLGTEGQGNKGYPEKYRNGGMAIPAGVGLKVNIWAIFGLSVEWGVRRTWTDYFDDISRNYPDPAVMLGKNGNSTLASKMSDQSLLKEGPTGTNYGVQRGDPGRKDLYFFCLVSLNVRIDKKATTCWEGRHEMPSFD